ncbi:MAG: PKD domain-containing protein [Methanofollis sp.]|uniref:PKD domain-containing protein n=1 Tax=Methanofollis sp. TaxID=2052835 RepID=UPI0026256BA3|nr:PKD domain-containing protein [Methanofollis sp.]MDD4254556.1 PKD domain-containing protein [Methanofollis sp.]
MKKDATIAIIAIGLLCLLAMPAAAEETGLGAAVDAPDLVWTTDTSTKAWIVDTEHAVKGGSSARSGPDLSWGDSKIETSVTGPGTLTFSWNVTSPSSDYYTFSIDGVQQKQISGTESVWTEESFEIGSGEHTLTWTYHKGGMGVKAQNGGWLDAVTFSAEECTDFSANVTRGMAPLAVQFTDLSTGDVSGWDWDFGDGSDHVTEKSPAHLYQKAGTYNVTLIVQKGGSPDTVKKTEFIEVVQARTLGDAVGASSLAWTTGGKATWGVDITDGVTDGDSARSGCLSSSGSTGINTTVSGAGTLSFDWKANIQYNSMFGSQGSLEFSIDGATSSDGNNYRKITATKDRAHESFDLGEGEHTLQWTYAAKMSDKPENGGWLDNVTFTPKAVPVPTNLKEALDAPDLAWVNAGDKDWTVEVGDGIGGGCARSGTFSADEWEVGFSDLQTGVTGPGTLTFSWKVSCDEYYEALYFALDGKDQMQIDGLDETWKDATFEVGPGEHVLKWSYWKNNWNGDESDGKSCGWLDNVSYTQEIATAFTANTTAGDAPLTVQFTDQSTGAITARHWDFGDGTTSDEKNPVHTFAAGVYDVSLTVTRDGADDTVTKAGYIRSIGEVTLAEALDAPDLAWTTGGNATWSPVKGPEYVDYAAAKSAGALTSGQKSWVRTTVEGPCTLSFDWKVNPGKVYGMPLGKMEFAVDDAGQYDDLYKKIQYDTKWYHETYPIGHGTHTVTWTYSTLTTDTAENGGWLDNVTYTYGGGDPVADFVTNVTENRGMAPLAVQFTDTSAGFPTAWSWDFGDGSAHAMNAAPVHVYENTGDYPVTLTVTNIAGKDADGTAVLGTDTVTKTVKVIKLISLGEAVEAPELTWTTGGDLDWFTDLYCALTGGSSARTGAIPSKDNATWIETTVTGPGVLTFNWNINSSSSTYCGLLVFSADGTRVSQIKGTQEGKYWPGGYYEVPPGEHALRWTYTNAYYHSSHHCGHLDNVTYTSGAIRPTAAFEANVTRAMAPATVQFTDTSSGCPTAWSWDFGDGATSDRQHPAHTFEEVRAYTVTLTVTNDAGTSTATETVSVVPFATLAEAVEAPDFEWSTGGNAPWFVDVDCVHTGTTSARSGAIGDNQESWLQANITGPGYLAFAWNVSSEPRHDYLRLFIDGEEEKNIFGFPEEWTEEEYRLGFGTHAVRWVYEKDSTSGMMEDCGWVDNVTFTPVDDTDFVGNVTWGEAPLTVDFTGYATGNPTHWAWDFGDEDSAVGRNQTHTYTKPGVYNVTLIVQKGTAPDGQMEVKKGYITVTPTFEEALDAEGLAWTRGGDAPWFVQLSETFVGGSCGQSGAITRNQQTWIETTVTGPKNLTFDWQVSSYDGYSMKYSDVLAFSIDGEIQEEIAGKGDGWQTAAYTLEKGEHTLRWTYEKRAYNSYGEDCGWLDNVTLTDIAPVISFAPVTATVAAGTERNVAIVVDHFPDGLKNYTFTVSLDNDNARITDVCFATMGGAQSREGVLPGTTVTISASDDGTTVEAGAANVVLATLKVRGLADGTAGITASDAVVYADNGEETPVICKPGIIDVVGLSPLPGCVGIPGDGDGDGLFEDVNGDGTLDFRDIITYFEHVESVLSQKNPRVFDYNGNGRIDFDDIVTVHRSMETDRI